MERFSRSHHFSSFLPVIFHTVPNCAQRRPRPLSTTVSIPHFNLDSSDESTLRTAAELAELRSQFERSIQTTDLDDKIKAWCSLHNIDPEWLWSKRPVYCISINGEHKQEDEEALQRVRRLAENTGFFHIRKEDRILVRASSALQQLLDRLAVSIAAHEPQLVVEIAEEFPKNADAWQRKILTIDNKPAIYRRVALQKTKAIDPYPAMLKV